MPITDAHETVAEFFRLTWAAPPAARDRAAITRLFLPDARIRGVMADNAGVEDRADLSITEYLDLGAPVREGKHAAGIREEHAELWHHAHAYGNIAQVFSTTEVRVIGAAEALTGRTVHAFQLIRVQGTWCISALAFHVERRREPIPPEYLGQGAVAFDVQ